MTRDEFLEKCDLLRYETKYSAEPWHIWLAEMDAHDDEQRQMIQRLEKELADARKIIDSLHPPMKFERS